MQAVQIWYTDEHPVSRNVSTVVSSPLVSPTLCLTNKGYLRKQPEQVDFLIWYRLNFLMFAPGS